MVATSRSSGTFSSRKGLEERSAAHMMGSAAFFAPEMRTSPSSGRPPVIRSLSTLPFLGRERLHGQGVDFLAHALAERGVDQLVALYPAAAGERRRHHERLEVLPVAHHLDMLLHVLGPPVAVWARTATLVNEGIETEDCAAAVLRWADGSLATVASTTGSAAEVSRLRFTFEHLTAESSPSAYSPGSEPWTWSARAPDAQGDLDAFLAVEKHLLVRQGIFRSERVRGPVGYALDAETRREVDRLRRQGVTAMHLHPFDAIVEQLENICRPGDLLVIMGAGPVWQVGREFLKGPVAGSRI